MVVPVCSSHPGGIENFVFEQYRRECGERLLQESATGLSWTYMKDYSRSHRNRRGNLACGDGLIGRGHLADDHNGLRLSRISTLDDKSVAFLGSETSLYGQRARARWVSAKWKIENCVCPRCVVLLR